ncbi:response regulator transcription factor [Novosphingobium terrae]|uniref:response regulator transcription factor n=1 Tax=Novosphingobium terrae TaxID=2726189 RepID=UPI001981BF13|nr:response regulator [Novosphingobium terrae]
MSRSLIAVVDDDELVRSATVSLLRSMDYDCCAFASAEEFLLDQECDYKCVVSDLQMPGISGVELAHRLASREPRPPVILITAYPDTLAFGARDSGLVAAMIEKPLDSDALLAAIEKAIDS